MKNSKFFLIAALCLSIFFIGCDMPQSATGPGQPETGYGSAENYISDSAKTYKFGNNSQGLGCIYYIPDQLISDPAPVVVFMHGMALQKPAIYQHHIKHLVRQGIIVVFPNFNKEGFGLFSDTDQNDFLARAEAIIVETFKRLGPIADLNNVTYYGHSVGGLLATSLQSNGLVPEAQAIVLANATANVKKNNPMEPDVTPIDWEPLAKDVTCPVFILTVEEDTIAEPGTGGKFYDGFMNSPFRIVYMAQSDKSLTADHMAPGSVKTGIASSLGGNMRLDTYDFRYFWAALDAVIDGKRYLEFDMGEWKDGTPVLPIVQVIP